MKRVIFGILLLGLSLSANAQRDYSGTWEWSISALYQDSKSMGSENGSSLKADSAIGLGFNVGYYLTDHFSLGADFDFLRPDYNAVLVDDTVVPAETTEIKHEMSQFNGRFKANLDFLDGPFRPFVEAGLGWTYFDSNVADGPPIVGCWWHPYWGYICDGYYRTFSETVFSYGVGAAGNEDLTGARLEYGWRF